MQYTVHTTKVWKAVEYVGMLWLEHEIEQVWWSIEEYYVGKLMTYTFFRMLLNNVHPI